MRGAAPLGSAGLLAALAALPAGAQTFEPAPYVRGFDAVPQKATPLTDSAITVEGALGRAPGSWHGVLLFDWNVQPLAYKVGDEKHGNFIPWRIDGHLLGSWTPLSFLELGGDLPVTFAQGDNFQEIAGVYGPPFSNGVSGGLGDIRLVPRLFAPASWKLPIGIALIPEVRFPTGDGDSFLGDLSVVFAPRLAVERAFGSVRLLLNVGLRFREAARFLNIVVDNELTGGGAAVWALPSGGIFHRPELMAETSFSTPLANPFASNLSGTSNYATTPWEFLIGARTRFSKHIGAELDLGRGVSTTAGYGREAFRLLASLRIDFEPEPRPVGPDRDGDGVPDALDRCPDEPGDGPDGCPDLDWDKDGIPNVDDRCPHEPGTREMDGCPDRDHDGIPDPEDKCPDEPGPAENDGCPVQGPLVTLESDRVRLKGSVHFDTDKAVIKPESFPLLDEVVGVLSKHPELHHVRVEGHTDNRGSWAYNQDLSKRRAASVMDYLAQHGIDRKRLLSAGFGYDRPIADNDTALGRAKNRRVEFRLLEDNEAQKSEPKR
jgi:OOP family OmpA-OmpF porin